MAAKFLQLTCLRRVTYGDISVIPHYPSTPTKYPKGVSEQEKQVEGSESRALFSVVRMTCSGCAGCVEKAIRRLAGIKEAMVDVLNSRAQVLFHPSFVNEESIREAIEDVGFEATIIEDGTSDITSQVCRIQINGTTCTACSSTVKSALRLIWGVQRARVALATEEAEIYHDPRIINTDHLLSTVEDTDK